MASIFEQLGYNYTSTGNDIVEFTGDVLDSLQRIPPLLDEWAYEDLRNQDSAVTNYLRNPTKNVTLQIVSTVNSLLSLSSSVSGLSSITTSCRNIVDHFIPGPGEFDPPIFVKGSSNSYIEHCDRLSGLVQPNENTAELPHYDMAIGVGKSVMYLVYQSDGIQNNAPIMGSFTSLFVKEELESDQIVLQSFINVVNSSISCSTSGDPPETTCSSNLSPSQVSTITTKLNSVNDIFTNRRIHDENYYLNARTLLDKYEEMKRYKNPGQSEKNLFDNYIGTERLKNNLP
jgi:hypothetical protein